MFPKLGQIFRVKVFPKDVSDFFVKLTRDCINYRRKNCHTGNDILQFLMDLEEDPLTTEVIAAQCVILFLTAFETSASALTFAFYELAKNQILQDKARDEIERVLANHEGKFTYETVQSLKYLGQVLDETWRKYPPVLFLTRRCVKDYKIPTENAIIEKGTLVLIPVHAIHHDEEHYPYPEILDPERFSQSQKISRQHYTFLSFGEGSRICIGKRFGSMQAKIPLAILLKHYRFTVNKNTMEPLIMKRDSFTVTPATPIWLNVQKL